MNSSAAVFMFLSIGSVAMFSFIAVAAWSDARRREREAYYRNETLQKIALMPQSTNNPVLELFREEERAKDRKHMEGLKIGGLVNMGVGVGVFILLKALVQQAPVFLVGVIPFLIGLALLIYAYMLAPRQA